ncbi:MAG TPA: 6-carboxytetrahydropterin synthase [Gemmataceae bacterium]|jgi:6-pyruvoyltetrahydropterin/6-carboxytetrahydropterin synthase
MFSVTREITFCYGHRLLDYDGKCRHLHGHNGRAVITLAAPTLDQLGMVMDFTRLKGVVGAWIDENLDHKMLLHKDDPILPFLRQHGEPVFVLDVNPTAENIARLIFDFTAEQGFPVVEVKLWETESCFAAYSVPKPARG